MKKSKFITGLSAAFISAMALMSCSSLIKARSGVVLTIDGHEYTAAELFEDQKTPAAAEAKFNAVYKAAVRTYFKNHTEYDKEIENDTKIKISEQKATAQSNADKNGTSYAVEWQKILDSNNVDDENGLFKKFQYDLQKEKFENNFYDGHYDELRNVESVKPEERVFGDGFVDYFKNKQPYHVKHILVKIAGLGNNNTDGTITAAEAEKLYNVITELASGTSFDQVSKSHSDDEAAKEAHASLGIMSRDTSFVNDFKLGTYFYEAFYGKSTSNSATDKSLYDSKVAETELFGNKVEGKYPVGSAGAYATDIHEKVIDPTGGETLGVIPFEAALMLGKMKTGGYGDFEYKDSTSLQSAGIKKEDFKDKFLPRNVIFNKFFNKHNIMVIAPAKMPVQALTYGTQIKEQNKGSIRTIKEPVECKIEPSYITGEYEGFNRKSKNGDEIIATNDVLKNAITENSAGDQHVLRDDNGRTIFVFRSGNATSSTSNDEYSGIHFVVIERSPFIGVEYEDNNAAEGNDYNTTLDEYYTERYPGQSSGMHPTYKGGAHAGEDKHTYANYSTIDKLQVKKDRADKVKSELKNCMPNLNTFVYEYLLKDGTINFNPKMKDEYGIDIKQDIKDWIDITREDSAYQKKKDWDNNWQNYCYSLEAINEARKDEEIAASAHYESRVASQLCLNVVIDDASTNFSFTASDKNDAMLHMFGVGGVFHE